MNHEATTPIELAHDGWKEAALEMNEVERMAACAAISKRVAGKELKVPSSKPSTRRTDFELLLTEKFFLKSIDERITTEDDGRQVYYIGERGLM